MKKRSSLFDNAGISTIKEEDDQSPNGKLNLRHIGSRSGLLSSEFKSGSKEEIEDEGVSSMVKAAKITSNPQKINGITEAVDEEDEESSNMSESLNERDFQKKKIFVEVNDIDSKIVSFNSS